MGNQYSINKYYPYNLVPSANTHLVISTMNHTDHNRNPKIFNSQIIHASLSEVSYDIVILFCSNQLNLDNYEELCTRLVSKNMIVISVKINNKTTDKINTRLFPTDRYFNTMMHELTNTVKKDFVVNYRLNVLFKNKIYIGHQTTCNDLVDMNVRGMFEKDTLVLLDPQYYPSVQASIHNLHKKVTNQDFLFTNMNIILPVDHVPYTSTISRELSQNVLMLTNVRSSNIYNISSSNMKEITEKSDTWDIVGNAIANTITKTMFK